MIFSEKNYHKNCFSFILSSHNFSSRDFVPAPCDSDLDLAKNSVIYTKRTLHSISFGLKLLKSILRIIVYLPGRDAFKKPVKSEMRFIRQNQLKVVASTSYANGLAVSTSLLLSMVLALGSESRHWLCLEHDFRFSSNFAWNSLLAGKTKCG